METEGIEKCVKVWGEQQRYEMVDKDYEWSRCLEKPKKTASQS